MAAITTAGTKLFVSSSLPATYDRAGFEALEYEVVGEITDIGEYGKEYALVTYIPLATRQTKKKKGSYNTGSLALQLGRDINDAGQIAMINALDSDSAISYKIQDRDGATDYFAGKVMSYRKNIGGVDSVVGASAAIEINTELVTYVKQMIEYLKANGVLEYSQTSSGDMVVTNQGSTYDGNDLLLHSGRGIELGVTQYVDIPIHHELGSEVLTNPYFTTDISGWSGNKTGRVWEDGKIKVPVLAADGYVYTYQTKTVSENSVYLIEIIAINNTDSELEIQRRDASFSNVTTLLSIPASSSISTTIKYNSSGKVNPTEFMAYAQANGTLDSEFYIDTFSVKQITNPNSYLTYYDLVAKEFVYIDNSLNTPSTTYRFADGTYNNILVDKTEWDATDKAKIEADPNLVGDLALSETGSIDELNKTLDEDDAWYPGMEKDNMYLVDAMAGYGTETVTNGTFDTDTDWSKSSSWTISGGTANCDGSESNGLLYQNIGIVTGSIKVVEYEVSSYTSGNTYPLLGGLALITTSTSVDKYSVIGKAGSSGLFYMRSINFIGSIDNVSVREATAQEIANYTATVRDNADFQTSGLQTTAFVRDTLGVPTAYDDTALNWDGDGDGGTQWNPSLESKFWLEEIVDGVIYQHKYDGTNLTTYTDNVAGTPTAHSPENADYIFGKGVYPKVTADPYTESVHIPVSVITEHYDSYDQAERYTYLSSLTGA